jgi:NhaP-type Na+/H+ or K+/H+ antiporter
LFAILAIGLLVTALRAHASHRFIGWPTPHGLLCGARNSLTDPLVVVGGVRSAGAPRKLVRRPSIGRGARHG